MVLWGDKLKDLTSQQTINCSQKLNCLNPQLKFSIEAQNKKSKIYTLKFSKFLIEEITNYKPTYQFFTASKEQPAKETQLSNV